jgi:tRNA-2-methylthio-N6-dimethylallyladenosine synthase
MNVADSELITSLLLSEGMEAVHDIDLADVIIFNTCSVRQHAEDRVLGRISNEKKRKLTNPQIKIGIVGCMAQRIGSELVKKNMGLDFAVGVDQYHKLGSIIRDEISSPTALEFNREEVYSHLHPTHSGKTNGFVTIMRGCNNFCTYCIVPYVRGRERSRSFEEIYSDVVEAGRNGLKDMTLLGQNVNSYSYQGMNFPQLLRKLNEIDEIERLRYITSHPKDLSDELIAVMAECDKVCEHIHLPMQSGSTRVLSLMNRQYSFEHYRGLISKLRVEEEFLATLDAVRQLEFDYAFCFKYSHRAGTKACDFKDELTEEIRLARLQKLIDVQREITLHKFKAQIGKNTEIYIEGPSKKSSSQVSGSTRDFKIAVVNGTLDQVGTLVKAKVVDATAGTLICEPL